MGIGLGLGAALCWGLADYFAAVASRDVGALRVVLGFHVAAMVPLATLVVATNGLSSVGWSDIPLFAGLGAVGWVSYLAFYGALAIGPISVLSPIVSGYAAVTVLLAVLVSGERPGPGEVAAVVVTIAGVMVASAGPRERDGPHGRRALIGVALALVAMALLGAFVFGVSYKRARLGWLAPIFLARAFATLFLLAHTARSGQLRLRGHSGRVLAIMALLAGLDTGGYVCFNLGVGLAATSVVATASAPYAVVPILMGVMLFGERPTRTQWGGVTLVIGGLILLGLAA